MSGARPATDRAVALLRDHSLEMTGKDLPDLAQARDAIPAGTRVNITFLGSEDLEVRVAAAGAVAAAGFTPVPHVSARRLSSRAQLVEFLDRLQQVGASEQVFAVGGDPATPAGPYPDALSVIRSGVLQEYGVRAVSVAGYPEGHPDIPDDVLWSHLLDKTAALREQGLDATVLTQFAFDTGPVLAWVADLRSRGVDAEVRVGTPGPAGVRRLLGFARRFGIGANAMVAKKYGFSLTNLVGTAGPDRFVGELADLLAQEPAAGRVKLHFYTFGGLSATADWAAEFVAGRR